MKITKLRNLLSATFCMLAGIQAQAQFSGSVDQYPTTNYLGSPITFSLEEVATALGTDETTLGQALQNYIGAETPDPLLFSLQTAGGDAAWTQATTANGNGFWMTATGEPIAHGEGAVFYFSPSVESDATKGDVNDDGNVDVADISSVLTEMAGSGSDLKYDVNGDGTIDVADISTILTLMAGGSAGGNLVFSVGQMPSVMQAGQSATATVKLTFNDKSVTFDLTLNVIAKPDYNVPQPTILESQLNIVGQTEKVVEQYPRGGYDSDNVELTLEGVQALLGIPDMHLLEDQIDTVVYTTWYNSGDVEHGGGLKKDSLTNVPTGEGHGFWYRAVQNADGIEDGEVASAPWDASDKFYLNNFAYTFDTNTLSCQLGQYGGVCKDNETWFSYVYLIYGEKAYRIKYTLKLMEKEQGTGMASYNKVGEASVTVEQEPTEDYSTVTIKPDMEAIAAALGCEVSAIAMNALDDKDNFGGQTANNGGYWFSDAGTVVSHGASAAMFIEPQTANDFSALNVGQYPNHFTIGDQCSSTIYFMNGENYYQYTVTLKLVEPTYVEHGFESVATRAVQLQTRVSPFVDQYQCDPFYTISPEEIEALIGTTTPTLYGLNNDSIAAAKGLYSAAYSCDPKPGFWLDKEGYVSKWGSSPVGICWLQSGGGYVEAPEGSFELFQMPGLNSVGDVFKTTLFLVNEENNKMITFNFAITFVEKLTPVETVGSENITLPLDMGGTMVKIDAEKVCDALGITVDELVNPNNYPLRGLTTEGVFGEAQNAENGLSFAMDGGYDSYGDIYFTLEMDGDDVVINIACANEVEEGFSVDGQFCIEMNEQRYIYYVKFVSPELAE